MFTVGNIYACISPNKFIDFATSKTFTTEDICIYVTRAAGYTTCHLYVPALNTLPYMHNYVCLRVNGNNVLLVGQALIGIKNFTDTEEDIYADFKRILKRLCDTLDNDVLEMLCLYLAEVKYDACCSALASQSFIPEPMLESLILNTINELILNLKYWHNNREDPKVRTALCILHALFGKDVFEIVCAIQQYSPHVSVRAFIQYGKLQMGILNGGAFTELYDWHDALAKPKSVCDIFSA